ncbi:MAG: alpha/beta hydrolase [Burkholderiaceae bacterium]
MNLLNITPTPIKLASGVTINYARAGSGPALFFIHGAMGDWRMWASQWEPFTAQFDCISYSRRYTQPNSNPLLTDDHSAFVDAEDLLGIMDGLGIEKAVLVGSSYGGFTALALAVQAPERVLAVVSVEAPMMRYGQMTEAGAKVVQEHLETSSWPARDAFLRGDDRQGVAILTGGIMGIAPEDIPADVLERRMGNALSARSLSVSRDAFPLIEPDALAALPMPVLLVSGAKTAPIHAAVFAQVRAAMPDASVSMIPDAGHSVALQQPQAFNAAVLAFLERHGLATIG